MSKREPVGHEGATPAGLSLVRELWELESATRGVRELVELLGTGGVMTVGSESRVAFAAVALLRLIEERLRLVAMAARGEVEIRTVIADHNAADEDGEDAEDAALRPPVTKVRRQRS